MLERRPLLLVGLSALPAIALGVFPDVVRSQGRATPPRRPLAVENIRHDVSPPLRDIPAFHPGRPELGRRFEPENEEQNERGAAAHRRPVVKDPVEQRSAGPRAPLSFSHNFDGIGSNVAGFSVSGAPPDTNGAVGLTQYVQSVNSALAVYDKNTSDLLLGPEDFRTLYTGFGGLCETNGGSDPVVLYDKLANRWILSILVSSAAHNFECFAVSASADATGAYYRYAIPFGSKLNDFPKLGVWPDAYYFSGNEFDQGPPDIGLVDRRLCAIQRDSVLAGADMKMVCFLLPVEETSGAVLPADMDGPTPPPPGEPDFFFVLGADDASLRLYKLHADFDAPGSSTLSAPLDIPVAPFNRLCPGGNCIPQPGSTQLLSSIGDVPNFRVAYRNFGDHEAIVLNHSVQAGPNGGVRWYEIRDPNGTPVVFQQGTYVPDSSWRWMGGIATDKAGNIAVGYSLSSSTVAPSIAVTGRGPADPLGTLGAEQLAFAGAGSQQPTLGRWGDYSAMTVDPEDDCTFWYTTMYLPGNGTFNWRTRIASFSLPGCAINATAALAPSSLAFGPQAVGSSSAAQTLTLANAGPGAVAIGSIAVSGDFSQTNNCGVSLTAGSSCSIQVTFTPTAAGTRVGRLTVSDDASNAPQGASMAGTGVDPAAGVTAIDFGAGFSAAGLTLNGGAAINGSRLRLTDGGANQARSAFFSAPLAVEFFTTDFSFRLSDAIAEGFTFTIQGNAPTSLGRNGGGLGYGGTTGGIPKSVAVKFDLASTSGEGGNSTGVYTDGVLPSLPALNLAPTGVNLHTGHVMYVHIGYDGAVLAWTVTDSETGRSFAGSAEVDIPGHAGAATAFVGFTAATGAGAATATQDILSWTFQTPGVVAPFVAVSPNSLAYVSQDVGSTSPAQVLTLTNQGPGSVTIADLALDGDFTQTSSCPSTLGEAESCSIAVRFSPSQAGPRRGTLSVRDDAFNHVQRAGLIGVGLSTALPTVVDFRGGFSGSALSLNGGAALSGSVLRLTDGGRGEARSAFFTPPLNVQSFVSDFTFQLTTPNADGFTFVLQRSGPSALGGTGGGLGYGPGSAGGSGGIPGSLALKFDLFNSAGEGNNSTGLFTGGQFPGVPALDLTPSGINLHSGHVFYAHVDYDGASLAWTITDATTGASFTTSQAIDIPAAIGGAAAFAGFTGGTGGLTAIQDILSWTFQTEGTTPAYATVDTAGLSFGSQALGASSAPQTVTLTNHGPVDLHIASIAAGGDFGRTTSCGAALPPGGSCTIDVVFTPTASGPRPGRLTIDDDAAIAPQVVALSGTGLVPGGAVVVDFGGGFTAAGLTLNGATISGSRLRITDGGGGEARSVFATSRVDARAFVNDFAFQLTNADADGFTFAIQGNTPTALGGSGGGLGYGPPNPGESGGLPNSVAVKFDLYDGEGEGFNSTGAYANGVFPGLPAFDLTPSGIDLHGGDVLYVHMTYDGATLSWTISEPVGGHSFSASAPMDIPALVGGPTAFVGFTGGTGGLTAVQDILAWTYQTDAGAPLSSLAPGRLVFDEQPVGTSSGAQTLTLTNSGPGDLALSAIQLSGDFSQTNDCGATLAAGGHCTIQVAFAPSAVEFLAGSLTLADDGFVGPHTVGLSGTGVKLGSRLALSSSAPSSTFGDAVTFSAVVSPAVASTAPPATGVVRFMDGETSLGTAALSGGTARFETSALAVGSHAIVASYDGDGLHEAAGSAAVTQTVSRRAPLLSWGAPAPILYGTPLDGTQLDAAADVPGRFAYTPSGGAVLAVGLQTLSVTFTPDDTSSYATATTTVSLRVNPASLTIAADAKSSVLHGPLPSLTASYSGFVAGEGPGVLGGTLRCSTAATAMSPIGTYAIHCSGRTSSNYVIRYVPASLAVIYAPGGSCQGEPGHDILPPISPAGTSIFAKGASVTARFRVCDALGLSVGPPRVVETFELTAVLAGASGSVPSTAVDHAFHWDPRQKQWLHAIDTGALEAGHVYVFRIGLKDGSSIGFRFGVR